VVFRRVLLAAAVLWAGVIPLAAFAATRPQASPSVSVFALVAYAVGHVICHQLPLRSFHLWGAALPVCARCTGIYVGAAAAALWLMVVPARGRHDGAMPSTSASRIVLVAVLLPTAATLLYEWTTGTMPSHMIRALAGAPIGIGVIWLIASADLRFAHTRSSRT
jgi:uncharacterized membrane protein